MSLLTEVQFIVPPGGEVKNHIDEISICYACILPSQPNN